MVANLIIIVLITALVLVFRAKIKSKYDEKSYRRELNRRSRLKNDVVIIFKKREKMA